MGFSTKVITDCSTEKQEGAFATHYKKEKISVNSSYFVKQAAYRKYIRKNNNEIKYILIEHFVANIVVRGKQRRWHNKTIRTISYRCSKQQAKETI